MVSLIPQQMPKLDSDDEENVKEFLIGTMSSISDPF